MLTEEFSKFWEIYDSSFPEDEKRDKQTQRRLLSNNKYKIIPYYNNGQMVGFAALWMLGDIVFFRTSSNKKKNLEDEVMELRYSKTLRRSFQVK